MVLLWEGIETYSLFLDFTKDRKTLELQLAREFVDQKKMEGTPDRFLEYIHHYHSVYAPLTDYLMYPETKKAEVIVMRWKRLYNSVHKEWRPYLATRVRYMLNESISNNDYERTRTYVITGPLAESLRTMEFHEFLNIDPSSLLPPKTKEAAGFSPTAFIHNKAKALTRAFTYMRKIVHV